MTTPSQRDLSTAFTREMATYLGGREVLYIDSWPEPSSSAKMEKNTSPNIQQDPSPPPIDYCTAVRDRAMRNGYWKCHSVLPPFSRLCFRLGSYYGIGYAVSYHFALGLVFPLVKQFASRLPDQQFHGTENNTHHRW